MSQTIRGTYKDGTISLDRLPDGVSEARVVVEFVEQLAPASDLRSRRRGIVYFGMFAPPDGRYTSEEDIEQVKKSWNAKLDSIE